MFLGIDFGTSGARAIAISNPNAIAAETHISFPVDPSVDPSVDLAQLWRTTLFNLIEQIPRSIRAQIQAIAINGTSSTVLLCDAQGMPIDQPMLYNDNRGAMVLDRIRAIAPAQHTVINATSSLAKLLWWMEQEPIQRTYFLHQADWLAFLLHGQLGVSDYHNALKLGYDVEALGYPDWLLSLKLPVQLPEVLTPGTAIAPIHPDLARQLQLPPQCQICAGTTDSIAAFLASGVIVPGEAVTSLGSTLVLKLLSQTRIERSEYGIYSHRFGAHWLVGGASNTGGAVLRSHFSSTELMTLSQRIDPTQESQLDYYPLLQPGERFPINDATLQPRLDPRPADPVEFLHGLLESMARIEAEGYRLLQEFGASPLQRVYTAGGGAKNEAWTVMRSRYLKVPVQPSKQTEAAYGTALLAMHGHIPP
jgi:D-ribulokinase